MHCSINLLTLSKVSRQPFIRKIMIIVKFGEEKNSYANGYELRKIITTSQGDSNAEKRYQLEIIRLERSFEFVITVGAGCNVLARNRYF